jgi:hypothetical protein
MIFLVFEMMANFRLICGVDCASFEGNTSVACMNLGCVWNEGLCMNSSFIDAFVGDAGIAALPSSGKATAGTPQWQR